MAKRHVEVFTTGCPGCAPAVGLVEEMAGPDCEIVVRDLRTEGDASAKATEYGITCVPAVVVNGRVATCCQGVHGPTREGLAAAGVGGCA